MVAAVIVVLLVAGGLAVAVVGAKRYYVVAPGSAPLLTAESLCRPNNTGSRLTLPDGAPCARISVPVTHDHVAKGSVFMVTSLVGPATPVQYVLAKLGLQR